MKLRLAPLSLLALDLILAAVPATAQAVYSNGPTNGNTDAWTVNFRAVVSDSFNVSYSTTTITGAEFAMWLYPGDTLTSAQLSITSLPFGGTSYFDQTVNFTQLGCISNDFGYNVCDESTTFNGPRLNSGTYWLTLQNALVPSGDPIYWDENSGPSHALQCCNATQPLTNAVGTIPSEAFTILGFPNVTATTIGGPGTVPEPTTMMLFGSGILTLVDIVRRKLF
jgi:hypothetical protein